jgi:hypothetical protein
MKAMHEDPEVAPLVEGWYPKWGPLVILGSKKKGEIWTEVEELRVEFK